MKRLVIIGCSILVLILAVTLLWQFDKISRDRGFRRELAGTWSWELYNIRSISVFAPDGSFAAQRTYSHPTRTDTNQMSGTWLVKDGDLIEIVASDTNKRAKVPRTHVGRIIRENAQEFAVIWQDSTNESVWQRVSQ